MPRKQVMLLDYRTALAKTDKDQDKDAHTRGHVSMLEEIVQICLIYRTADPPDSSLREFRKKGSDYICQLHQVRNEYTLFFWKR